MIIIVFAGNDVHMLGSRSRNRTSRYCRFKNTTSLKRRLFSLKKMRRRNRNCDAENNRPSRSKKHVSGGSKVGHGLKKYGKRKETALHIQNIMFKEE